MMMIENIVSNTKKSNIQYHDIVLFFNIAN
jgi:hypothetical protein